MSRSTENCEPRFFVAGARGGIPARRVAVGIARSVRVNAGAGLICIVSIVAAAGHGCVQPMETTSANRPIEEVLKAHTPALMGLAGVVGTAQGLCEDKPCIKIYVVRKTPELARRIPGSLEGYRVVVEETGEIKALPGKPR